MQISHISASAPQWPSRFSRQEDISPHSFHLLWPAFFSLWLATASGSYALARFVAMNSIALVLLCALTVNSVLAVGAWCTTGWKRNVFVFLRPFAAMAVVGIMAAIRAGASSGDESGMEPNTLVTLMLGFVGVLSVVFVGTRIGGRTVPLLAPLVPVFSVFGLLCLLAPDAVVQGALVAFVASTLYLLTYARHIKQFCPELVTGKTQTVLERPHFTKDAETKVRRRLQSGAMMSKRWPLQSLLVSSLWFTLFLGGGLALYLPVGRYVPGLFGAQINRARAAAQNRFLDYRGGGAFMQLRGGHYALSDRIMLKITMNQGDPSGLWRGRVYEYYEGSLWQESNPIDVRNTLAQGWTFGIHGADGRPLRARPSGGVMFFDPKLSPLGHGRGQTRDVMEYVEPQSETQGALYASGQIRSWNEHLDTAISDTSQDEFSKNLLVPYVISSVVVEPNVSALTSAPGYDASSEKGLAPARLKANLQLPHDENARQVLKAIASSITDQRRRPLKTPLNKVRAISAYLSQNCRYSLDAPTVPRGEDAVTYFLVDSREGACDMFASSMVLLLRQMKVPARLASGYLEDENSVTRSADGRTIYTVRERDAHAWVEYFVPGFGWMTYDPTQDAQSAVSPLSQNLSFLLRIPELHFSPILGGLVCLMVGLMSVQGMERYRKRPKLGPLSIEDKGRVHILRVYERAKRMVGTRVRFEGHLTPEEFEARVSRSRLSSAAKLEFSALTHLAIAARYGELPAAAPHEVDACLRRLRKAL